MTAHHWRTVRLKMALAGISDPMALPTAHMLLDLVAGRDPGSPSRIFPTELVVREST